MESPRISICIPTYNRADLLKKTLISVSSQTVRPYEVIIVDNCSDDDTEAVSRSFPWFRYFKNERNLGLAGNWNRCIELAQGDYLTILHSDDVIAPTWCEELLRAMAVYGKGGVGAFFLPVFTIDLEENAKIVYYSLARSRLLKAGESFRVLWSRNMCALPASGGIVFRRQIFQEIGKFNESYTTETDILTALRILNRYPVYYHKKLLYAYRIHPFQTFDKEKQKKSLEKKFSVARNHLKIFRDFYNNELIAECRKPFFFKRLVYMYCAITFFYMITFRLTAAKKYWEIIHESFPKIRFTPFDIFRVLSVIIHYSNSFIMGRILAIPMKSLAKRWVRYHAA